MSACAHSFYVLTPSTRRTAVLEKLPSLRSILTPWPVGVDVLIDRAVVGTNSDDTCVPAEGLG